MRVMKLKTWKNCFGKSYAVVAPGGGIVNHVTLAENERDWDDVATRETKRQAEAIAKKVAWESNYRIDGLEVVEVSL